MAADSDSLYFILSKYLNINHAHVVFTFSCVCKFTAIFFCILLVWFSDIIAMTNIRQDGESSGFYR